MNARIKYTIKYHPRTVKKVANALFGFGVLVIVLLDMIWIPIRGLAPELQAAAILLVIPKVFWSVNKIGIFCIVVGLGLRLFRWRTGAIEVTEEKLIIHGSYPVSICIKNMWELDIRDMKYHRRVIRIDSNVDAVQVKFNTQTEFEEFSEKLIQLTRRVDNLKLNISDYSKL